MSTPVAQIRDGAVAISGRPVLRHIDFSVHSGEWVAVMGANGSGKSTLVRSLLGLRPLTAGTALLFDTPLAQFRNWHRVGFVPQRGGAASGVPTSVREVVSSGRLTRRRPFRPPTREDRRAVSRAIEVVGLGDKASDSIATLSGGQQQRTLIARALVGGPELLILDEPNAGVDLPHQQALADTLHTLSDQGATVVLVAHELGPLAPLVDRAVVMRDGRMAYDGPALDEADVFDLGRHHHHLDTHAHDHTPHIGGPFEDGEHW